MGTDDFSAAVLREFADQTCNARSRNCANEIVAVGTIPDIQRGRGRATMPTPVKRAAVELGLPTFEIYEHGFDGAGDFFVAKGAKLIILVSFKIVPTSFIARFPFGIMNLHPSLLPKFRGAAPVPWAIMRGLTESGLSTFLLEEKVDTGGILMQEPFAIDEYDTAGEIYARIASMSARLLARSIEGYVFGDIKPMQQNELDATSAPRILRRHRLLDFSQDAHKIHDKIRALSPLPGALCAFAGKSIKLFDTIYEQSATTAGTPGDILGFDRERLIVRTGDGILRIASFQPEGKNTITAEQFTHGYLKFGKRFERIEE